MTNGEVSLRVITLKFHVFSPPLYFESITRQRGFYFPCEILDIGTYDAHIEKVNRANFIDTQNLIRRRSENKEIKGEAICRKSSHE